MADGLVIGAAGLLAAAAGVLSHRMLWRRLPRLTAEPTPSLAADVTAGVVTGIIAALLAPIGTTPAGVVASAFFAVAGVQLSLIDARLKLLPNVLVLPSAALGLMLLAAAAASDGTWPAFGRAVGGGAVLFVVYLVLALLSPSGIGMGDVKLSFLVGSFLAFHGWMPLVVGAAAGFFVGAVAGLVLLALKRAQFRTTVPFGPAMIGGAVLVLAAIPYGFVPV